MISDIRLQNFRSYKDETFEFGSGVNIVVGPNASGKTNLLEGILVAANGGSYRATTSDLIMFNKPWARIELHSSGEQRVAKIDTRDGFVKKTFDIDGREYGRIPHSKKLPLVLFEPGHLRLLSGSPELRRDYLDDLSEQITPGYGRLRRSYKRALAQRNAVLKKGASQGSGELFAWNIRLSELGGQMAAGRQNLIDLINERISGLYAKLSNSKTGVKVSYESTCSLENYSSQLLKNLEANVEQDFVRGFTSHGPHRDDIQLVFNARHSAQAVASRGEVRTILLALKIVELQLIEDVRGQKPLLLLDDVFSELDGARRQALTKFLKDYQTFITTTDADVVVQHFMENCTIIPTTKS